MAPFAMPPSFTVTACTCSLVACLAVTGGPAQAVPPPGALDALLARLPETTLAAVATATPVPGWRAFAAALGDVPAGLPADVVGWLGVGFVAVRHTLGGAPEPALERLARGGLVAGWWPAAGGLQAGLVLRPGDMAAAAAWCERFAATGLARCDGDLLLLATSRAACEQLSERTDGRRGAMLLTGAPAAGDLLHGGVDLVAVRQWLGDRMPPAASGLPRLALAPFAHALRHGRHLDLRLHADRAVELSATVDASFVGTPLGELSVGSAAPADPESGSVLRLVLDRSWRRLLALPERFLDDADVTAVRGFLSIADALDGAATSFVDDLLGGLVEPIVFEVLAPVPGGEGVDVAAGPEHPPEPARVHLPGIVLTAPMALPAVEAVLRRMAQALATVATATQMQAGRPGFRLRPVAIDGARGFTAEPPPWRGPGAPPIDATLSPTLLCGRGHAVVASTFAAACTAFARLPTPPAAAAAGDALVLHGDALAAVVQQNRAVLELARVLDEGETPAEAQRFFDVVAAVAAAVRRLDVHVLPTAGSTRLRLRLERVR
jgi:hypothetical protein